jgi:chemotaxis protein CheX
MDTQEQAGDTQQHAGPANVRLGQVLDLTAAAPLAAELLAHRGRDVEVDATAVSRMGAQCLQVLLSARTTWREDGAAFAIVTPSEEFAAVLELLGAPLDQHFQASELSA